MNRPFRRAARRQSPGLGVCLSEHGMAMAQITPGAGPDSAATDWFWQPLTATESSPTVSHSVFDPEALRQARQRSGFPYATSRQFSQALD